MEKRGHNKRWHSSKFSVSGFEDKSINNDDIDFSYDSKFKPNFQKKRVKR